MKIDRESLMNSDLIESTFGFWFTDNEHIRSPFPKYIHPMLQSDSTDKFFDWVDNLHDGARDELNEQAVAEKFEEIIFETAHSLVRLEDEKLTILFPFLPRLGDTIYEDEKLLIGESTIVTRKIEEEGDHSFMTVELKKAKGNEIWETKFELPAPVNQ